MQVDLRHRRLVDTVTSLSVNAFFSAAPAEHVSVAVAAFSDPFDLLSKYPTLTWPPDYHRPVLHPVVDRIETTGQPVHFRARCLPPERLKIAKDEFQRMLNIGIVKPSTSCWSSPLHMVPKPNGNWRLCGNYRALNAHTTADRCPIPHMQDFTPLLKGARIFSKIDLVLAYHLIPIHPDDQPNTAITIPIGLFAAQSFQRFMDSFFRDLPFVFVYIDDILVASKDEAEHHRHLETIFQRLADNGITINAAKCLFAVESLDFLGHHISSARIRPMAAKVADIREFPQPESQRQLCRFLGMVIFYHRFIPNCAHTLAPLHDLANASRTRNAPLAWCDVSLSAFNDIKSSLADATLLVHPDTNAPTSVAVDSSSLALRAVLQQYQNGQWCPLAFFSRKLSAPERNYSTFNRELLAIYSAVKHFRYFLEGRVFTVYTEHTPLCSSLSSSTSRHSPREIRHLAFISRNSRRTSETSPAQTILSPMPSLASRLCPCQRKTSTWSSSPPMSMPTPRCSNSASLPQGRCSGPKFRCPVHLNLFCAICQPAYRDCTCHLHTVALLLTLHQPSHPGIRATRQLVTSKYVWTNMNRNVTAWARSCLACQRFWFHQHTSQPPTQFLPPDASLSHVYIDLVGPLP